MSLLSCPEAGCYQASCFKSRVSLLQYLQHVGLNQAQSIPLITPLEIIWETQTWGLNYCVSVSPCQYQTLLTQNHL